MTPKTVDGLERGQVLESGDSISSQTGPVDLLFNTVNWRAKQFSSLEAASTGEKLLTNSGNEITPTAKQLFIAGFYCPNCPVQNCRLFLIQVGTPLRVLGSP